MRKRLFSLILIAGILTSCSTGDTKEPKKVDSNNSEIENASEQSTELTNRNNLNYPKDSHNEIISNDISRESQVEDSSNINDSDKQNTTSSIRENQDSNISNESVPQNTQQGTTEEVIEDKYYIIIKEAWQRQNDYIESIDDAKVKQSIQTAQSAAIMESNRLIMEYPEDSQTIESSLKRVLNGE